MHARTSWHILISKIHNSQLKNKICRKCNMYRIMCAFFLHRGPKCLHKRRSETRHTTPHPWSKKWPIYFSLSFNWWVQRWNITHDFSMYHSPLRWCQKAYRAAATDRWRPFDHSIRLYWIAVSVWVYERIGRPLRCADPCQIDVRA